MKLYLIRHAIAEDARDGQSDADRALTREGIQKFQKAAAGIVKLIGEEGVPVILTSPLLRARQTAEILADALDRAGLKTQVKPTDALAPGNVSRLIREARGTRGPVAAVGHEPFLSQCIGELCFQSAGIVEMKKGAVATLELRPTGLRAELLSLLPPAVLRKL
jgi:phosphohistidine phosphatase